MDFAKKNRGKLASMKREAFSSFIFFVYKAPLFFTLRIRIWVVAYFEPKKNFKKNLKSSLLPWAAQTAQTEEFMFQNVAYSPTVYKSGSTIKS